MKKILAVLILIAPLLIVIVLDVHMANYPQSGLTIFEDGSFILEMLTGCLPWGICG